MPEQTMTDRELIETLREAADGEEHVYVIKSKRKLKAGNFVLSETDIVGPIKISITKASTQRGPMMLTEPVLVPLAYLSGSRYEQDEESLEIERGVLMDQIANSKKPEKKATERLLAVDRALYFARNECLMSEDLNLLSNYSSRNKAEPAARWRKEKKIFGIKTKNKWHHPAFQFKNGVPNPVIAQILEILPSEWDDWEIAFWFQSPDGMFEDADAPQDRLDDKNILDVVRRAAEPASF